MATQMLPSKGELIEMFSYDADTGVLTWKPRPLEMFTPVYRGKIWNRRYAGKEALGHVSKGGYKVGHIWGAPFRAHRVIWKMVYGVEPLEIDHINGCSSDNRLSNLRDVSHKANGRNTKAHKNNSTGLGGVHRLPSGSYHARITTDNGRISIGTFRTLEAAKAAIETAKSGHGYHRNHGRLEAGLGA